MPPVTAAPPALAAEFHRQVDVLLRAGHPEAAGMSPGAFAARLSPLTACLGEVALGRPSGAIPFVLVVGSGLVPVGAAMTRVRRRGRAGVSVLGDDDLRRFTPIEPVDVPAADAYLLLDVDLGFATRNLTPDAALEAIAAEGRSGLTLEEGVALVTQFPEAVARNAGFSLVGSRCGDRRVTALWISEGAPKLGWCWAGNPHTWLGSASCGGRVSA
jgi:hypothetical protein